MLRSTRRYEKGDTLIEVLFAVAVFSLIVVSALALMNQGMATAQRSLELTLVRQQVDSQAETLRFLHESYVQNYQSAGAYVTTDATTSPAEEYYKIIQYVRSVNASSVSSFGSASCEGPSSGKFILNTKNATVTTNSTMFRAPETYAQTTYNSGSLLTRSEGLWIEAVRSGASADSNQSNTGYIDFHIRGCWDAPGLNEPMNIGTIVRLYEPRG